MTYHVGFAAKSISGNTSLAFAYNDAGRGLDMAITLTSSWVYYEIVGTTDLGSETNRDLIC